MILGAGVIQGGGGGGGGVQKKPPFPPVPEAPSRANLDDNIREAEKHFLDAATPKWYEALDGAPGSGTTPKMIGHAIWFKNQVKAGGPWDYKQDDKKAIAAGKDSKYEDFGNFHFGAVGLAAGFSKNQLERGAGRVQTPGSPDVGGKPTSLLGELLGIGGEWPFGDQYKDSAQIRAGFDYYVRKFVKKDCE